MVPFLAKEIPKCTEYMPPLSGLMLRADITNQSQQLLSLSQAETSQSFSTQHSREPLSLIGADPQYGAYLLSWD